MPKITGGKAFRARLARITSDDGRRQIGAALFAAGGLIEDEAKGSIMAGSQSGKGHVASLPGQPPNNDTQHLHDNIETVQVDPLHVEVSSNASYSAALEFGTSKMAERPFMRPATAQSRKEITALVRRAVDKISRGGKVTG